MLSLTGPLALLAAWISSLTPHTVEKYYARGLYPWLAKIFDAYIGVISHSVAECLLWILPLVLATWGLHALRQQGWPGPATPTFCHMAIHGLMRLAGLASLLIMLFVFLWGLNYRRLPLATQLGWSRGPFTVQELDTLAWELRGNLEQLSPAIPRNASGAMTLEACKGIFREAASALNALPSSWPLHHTPSAHPKKMFFPKLLSLFHTYGVYCPWTGESHVNLDTPSCAWPFMAAHEIAHQKGFAREDEANFLAFAACSQHPDPRFSYSASLHALSEAISQLPPDKAKPLLKGLPSGVLADWKAERQWYERWQSPLSRMSRKAYSSYLKSQGQADGMKSYGRFLDLILAKRRDR